MFDWLDQFLCSPEFAWVLAAMLVVWLLVLIRRLHQVQHELERTDNALEFWKQLSILREQQRDDQIAKTRKLFTVPTQVAERGGETLYQAWLN